MKQLLSFHNQYNIHHYLPGPYEALDNFLLLVAEKGGSMVVAITTKQCLLFHMDLWLTLKDNKDDHHLFSLQLCHLL